MLPEGTDVLVLLAPEAAADDRMADGCGIGPPPMREVRSLLRAANDEGVGSVVALSSATVYGAAPGNPVPLTEEAPMRAEGGFALAESSSELERLVGEWRREQQGESNAAILRPVTVVDRDRRAAFQRSVWGLRRRMSDAEPARPLQLLDLDDLVGAIEVAVLDRLNGQFNVAPDGWLGGQDRDELLGRGLALPVLLRKFLGRRRGHSSPALAAYLEQPWVVANDRLRSAGWTPTTSTDELAVGLARRRTWSARSRQEISLAAGGVVLAATAAAVLLVVRRLRASRRAGR